MLGLHGHQLFRRSQKTKIKHWAVHVSPEEEMVPSKTNQFDETVLLDFPLASLEVLLRYLVKRVRPHESLLGLDYRSYSTGFKRAAELAGVAKLRPRPYSLRHGAASHDVLVRKVPLNSVQQKGRWRTFSSVQRYEQHARLLKELNRVPNAVLQYARQVEPHLCAILAGQRPPVPPPGAGARRLLRGL